MLGRPSGPPLPSPEDLPSEALPGDDEELELNVDADQVFVIMQVGEHTRPQPIIWPMRLHVHGQDCGRT